MYNMINMILIDIFKYQLEVSVLAECIQQQCVGASSAYRMHVGMYTCRNK